MKPVLFFLLTILLFTGCSGSAGERGGADERGGAVERYLAAVVASDPAATAPLVCADFEAQAQDEAASFSGVKAHLEDVTCTPDGDSAVTCTGAIIATYNNEDATIELDGKRFRVQEKGGEWLVCGYE